MEEEKEEQKKVIEQMFRSSDKELIKLAKRMCHSLKLDYYVLHVGFGRHFRNYENAEQRFSVDKDFLRELGDKLGYVVKIYQIKLERWKK